MKSKKDRYFVFMFLIAMSVYCYVSADIFSAPYIGENEIYVEVRDSVTLTHDNIRNAAVDRPDIVEMNVELPDKLHIKGLKSGKTQLIINYGKQGSEVKSIDKNLMIIDLQEIRGFIGLRGIELSLGSTGMTASGQVDSKDEYNFIRDTLEPYFGKLNLDVTVKGEDVSNKPVSTSDFDLVLDNRVTKRFYLKNRSSGSMLNLINRLKPGLSITEESFNQSLIVQGTQKDIDLVESIMGQFDIDERSRIAPENVSIYFPKFQRVSELRVLLGNLTGFSSNISTDEPRNIMFFFGSDAIVEKLKVISEKVDVTNLDKERFRVYQTRYKTASAIMTLVQRIPSLASTSMDQMFEDNDRGLIFVYGEPAYIDEVFSILEKIDSQHEIEFYKPKYKSPSKLILLLNGIDALTLAQELPTFKTYIPSAYNATGQATAYSTVPTFEYNLFPLDNSNLLMIKGTRSYIEKVKGYIEKFDIEELTFVYKPVYRTPTELITLLSTIKGISSGIYTDNSNIIISGNQEFIDKIGQFFKEFDIKQDYTQSIAKIFRLSSRSATEMQSLLSGITTNIVVDGQTNTMIVTDTPEKLKQVADFIDLLDNQLQTQVLIEAKFVELDSNYIDRLSIDWNSTFTNPAGTSVSPSMGSTLNEQAAYDIGGGLTIGSLGTRGVFSGLSAQNWSVTINALERDGHANIVSSPRMTSLNNQSANIQLITDQTYLAGCDVAVTESGGQTVTPSMATVQSGITLSVTPSINRDGTISMALAPSLYNFQLGAAITTTICGPVFAPAQTTRSSNGQVLLQNGSTIVLGGLTLEERRNSEDATPVLSKIPFLGNLFKSHDRSTTKRDLLLFITAHIVNPDGTYVNRDQSIKLDKK